MVNIKDCDKEPIHIPGLIQPHGMLFVISKENFIIEQVSANIELYLGLEPDDILNTPFLELFQETLTEDDINALLREFRSTKHMSLLNNKVIKVVRVEMIAHEHDDCLIVELEPTERERFDLHEVFNGVGYAITQMQLTRDLFELCQKTTDEVQRLTGYDRVMLYRFDDNWNGNVIAETLSGIKIETYMNHWFPSSDIPAQARQMLSENWLRSIPTVNFRPSPIVPTINPRTNRPLNLGKAIFRSPSPIHLEYLRNMNVGGTLTISLMKENKLWGLIACHHEASKPIKHDVRVACQFIGQVVSALISSREVFEDFEYSKKVDEIFNTLFRGLSTTDNLIDSLVNNTPNLLDLTSADGAAAAVYSEGEWTLIGKVPSVEEMNNLIKWIYENHRDQDVFATDALPVMYPPAKNFKHIAAGVLAISLPGGNRNFVLWFRPEVTQTVTWAGDPQKSIELENGTLTLHPRKSFEAWKQEVKFRSQCWKACEVEAARKLRQALVEFYLSRQFRRFQELADSVDQFIWTAKGDGQIDYYNRRWYEVTGLSENFKGAAAREKVVHPEDLERINTLWNSTVQKGEPYYSELRIRNKSGEYKWYLSKAVPVKDESGKVTKWYGSVTEIQRQKDTEVALKEAIDGRDDFISIASHEIKTPVTSMKLLLQLIHKTLESNENGMISAEKMIKNIERSERELKKLELLIDDLLNVTKIRSGQALYHFEKADVTSLTLGVLERFGAEPRVAATLEELKKFRKLEIVCDPFRIEQVITNLVSNALKYGNGKPVEVAITAKSNSIQIRVKDEGQGLSKENQALVFNRFERAVHHKGISGLGLGLFICKKIVETHKGDILIESEPGKGATFIVDLPKDASIAV